jgi:hypothetical protein
MSEYNYPLSGRGIHGAVSERMKPRSTVRLRVKFRTLPLAGVVLLFVSALQIGCTACRVAPSPTPSQRLAEALSRTRTLPSTAPVRPHLCPSFGVAGAPMPASGGHRVILSWRASAPADSKHSEAAGYCVYRSTTRKDPSPELINSVPFPGTSCTDDRVENSKKYYYVVRAISDNNVTSIVSNEARAAIPAGNKSNRSLPGPSAPLCREPARVK